MLKIYFTRRVWHVLVTEGYKMKDGYRKVYVYSHLGWFLLQSGRITCTSHLSCSFNPQFPTGNWTIGFNRTLYPRHHNNGRHSPNKSPMKTRFETFLKLHFSWLLPLLAFVFTCLIIFSEWLPLSHRLLWFWLIESYVKGQSTGFRVRRRNLP